MKTNDEKRGDALIFLLGFFGEAVKTGKPIEPTLIKSGFKSAIECSGAEVPYDMKSTFGIE